MSSATFNVPVGRVYHSFRYAGAEVATPQELANRSGAVVEWRGERYFPADWSRRRRKKVGRLFRPVGVKPNAEISHDPERKTKK